MSGPPSPIRRAVLEFDVLLAKLEGLAGEGDRRRYDRDERYRWVIQRIWIAAGNEAAVVESMVREDGDWRDVKKLRNQLAHQRLPDIDDDTVWRMTSRRPPRLRARLEELRW